MRVMYKRLLAVAGACLVAGGATTAFAQQQYGKSGKISGIDVTDGMNYGFRIYMGGAPICETSADWAFVNKNYDNYDAVVSSAMAAYLAGKTVLVYTVREGAYCKITYIGLR